MYDVWHTFTYHGVSRMTTLLTNVKPVHEHDCDECTFLGSFEYLNATVDAYAACDKSSHPYIARFGVDGDYATVDVASPLYKPCDELHVRSNDKLYNLRKMRDETLAEREQVLEQLGKVSMKLKSLCKEIEFWESK
jgi:hypothetical protein